MPFPRSSGVLLHPSSFPSQFGIGDLGLEAYRFIDFLKESYQQYWQVLPLGPDRLWQFSLHVLFSYGRKSYPH